MSKLQLYHPYSRKNVHDIFAPYTPFISNTGTWGLQGIVPIQNTRDLVLFVTLGSKQGHHTFQEGITRDGIVYWQSQPKQRLNSPRIQQLIQHNELENNIHLFYRVKSGDLYTYLGRLAYISHHPEREQPVYFLWRILDWNPTKEIIRDCCVADSPINVFDSIEQGYIPTTALSSCISTGVHIKKAKRSLIQSGNRDFIQDQQRNSEIGTAGEDAVYELETKALIDAGRSDLAEKVYLTREREGNTAPYDIHSFYPNGRDKYVEVKTTVTNTRDNFYISYREREFAREHMGSYVLFRLYQYNKDSGEFLYDTVDNIEDAFDFEPNSFVSKYKSSQ